MNAMNLQLFCSNIMIKVYYKTVVYLNNDYNYDYDYEYDYDYYYCYCSFLLLYSY